MGAPVGAKERAAILKRLVQKAKEKAFLRSLELEKREPKKKE